jgi:hypothetical protein
MRSPNAAASRQSFVLLARWWLAASQAEKFQIVKASIEGASEAPRLETLHLAIIAAEFEAEATRQR